MVLTQPLPPLRSASMLCTMHSATKHCGLRKRGNKALKPPRNEELYVFLFKHRFDLCSKMDALSSLPYRLIRGTWDKSRHRGYRIAICEYIELDLLYNRADKRSSILTELLHLTSKDLDSVGKEVFLSELCCARQYISTAAIIAKNVLSLNFSPLKESIQSSGKRQKRGSWATASARLSKSGAGP